MLHGINEVNMTTVAISNTPTLIALGYARFTILSPYAFNTGDWIQLTDDSTPPNWMQAVVQSYDGTSVLEVNVFATSGSGKISKFDISELAIPQPTTPTAGGNISGTAEGSSGGNVTGPITVTSGVSSITTQTGTGTTFVVQTSPTLITPTLGAAVATTPAQGDASTKVPTTAYLEQNDAGGFINKFRNPKMDIMQRGTSGTLGTSAAYGPDGWILKATGATGTWSQAIGMATSSGVSPIYALELVGNTSNTDVQISQRIESIEAANLAGQQVTCQFTITNNTGATLTPTISSLYPISTDNYTGTTADLAATNLQSVANGATATLSYSWAASANANLGYQVSFDFGGMNANTKNIVITAFDLRVTPGVSTGLISVPPPPEFKTIANEYTYNLRYYEGSATPWYWSGYANGSATFYLTIPFKTVMRVAPTM